MVNDSRAEIEPVEHDVDRQHQRDGDDQNVPSHIRAVAVVDLTPHQERYSIDNTVYMPMKPSSVNKALPAETCVEPFRRPHQAVHEPGLAPTSAVTHPACWR